MRLGLMTVSRELIASVIPDEHKKILDGVGEVFILTPCLDWLRQALKLPDNCKILDLSPHLLFNRGQVALRIECEDFVDTPEAGIIPEVEAVVRTTREWRPEDKGLDAAEFAWWEGSGVRQEYAIKREHLRSAEASSSWVASSKVVNFREFL